MGVVSTSPARMLGQPPPQNPSYFLSICKDLAWIKDTGGAEGGAQVRRVIIVDGNLSVLKTVSTLYYCCNMK